MQVPSNHARPLRGEVPRAAAREIAREFIHWLNIHPNKRWLVMGDDGLELARRALEVSSPASLRLRVPAAQALDRARNELLDERVTIEEAQAPNSTGEAGTYDVIVQAGGLEVETEPLRFVSGLLRLTRYYSTVALYVWDWADTMRSFARSSGGADEVATSGFDRAHLRDLFLDARFNNVLTTALEARLPEQEVSSASGLLRAWAVRGTR